MSTTYYSNHWNKAIEEDVITMRVAERGKDMDKLLFDLVSTVSPYGREDAIAEIICDFMREAQPLIKAKPYRDTKGNLHVTIGDKPTTMFSCHMDTVQKGIPHKTTTLRLSDEMYVHATIDSEVHEYLDDNGEVITETQIKTAARKAGQSYSYYTLFPNNGVANKRTLFGSNSQFDDWTSTDIKYTIRTVIKPTPCVLGADDKLGCYIMCRLIEAGVPGLYVFHIGEEVGGVGSSYLAKTYPDKFHNIDRCIAFDRKGYSDIITHQSGGRCCSDAFANALAKQMNPHLPPMQHMAPSSGGSFTDSANYTHLIAECTNVAVGYFDQHTAREKFDLEWLERHLLPALIKVDWDNLPVQRDPLEFSASPRFQSSRGYSQTYATRFGNRANTRTNSRSVVPAGQSTPSVKARKSQSALDKFDNCLNSIHSYDPEEGFFEGETDVQKRNRVLASILRDNLSLEDIADLVVQSSEYRKYDTMSHREFDDLFGTGEY